MSNDPSRIEAAEAGLHTELEEHGAHHHVTAADAVPHDEHVSHGGGHGADPNAGVLRGDPPTPAWVWTATAVGALTLVLCVLLALKIG